MTEVVSRKVSRECIEALNKELPYAGDFLVQTGRVKIREEGEKNAE